MDQSPIRIETGSLSATVAALGAELQTLTTATGDALLWHGDAAWWAGRSPILFPIVGKAPGDRIAVGSHEAAMGQHGFARRSLFDLDEVTASSCRHVLRDSEDSRALYPFAFTLAVTHALAGASLTVSAEITNRDSRPMPFGLGFHPAFAWPLPGGEGRPHEIRLDNGAEPAMARLRDGLLPPERLPSPFRAGRLVLDHAQFRDDAMIFPEGAGTGLRYGVPDGPALHFSFDNLPNLALWQKPGAPYLCVEPWHGMAAETGASAQIAERPGSLTLAPAESARFSWSVELRL